MTGAKEIMVCVRRKDNGQLVRSFGTCTVSLRAIAQWLNGNHVESVAMESSGVYWFPMFEELERQGFHYYLISSLSILRAPRRKSDECLRHICLIL